MDSSREVRGLKQSSVLGEYEYAHGGGGAERQAMHTPTTPLNSPSGNTLN